MGNIFVFLLWMIITFQMSPAFADNWMSKADLINARSNGSGHTVYSKQGKCTTVEQAPCFEISGKDIRFNTVQSVREGDFKGAVSVSPCADPASCVAATADVVALCGDASFVAFWGDLDGDSSMTDGISNMDDLETWCNRRKFVARLKVDVVRKAAVEAADSALVVERVSRKNKRGTRLTSLEDCAKNGNLTAIEQKACIRNLAKEIVRLRLNESDL